MNPTLLEWKTLEHTYTEKSRDWYWSVGIVSLTMVILAIIFGNILFSIFLIVASISLILFASRKPDEIICSINDKGIMVDKTFYPFLTLDSFWIDTAHHSPKLSVKSSKTVMPMIYIPLGEANPDGIRKILLKYISETEHAEPISHLILERLGF